MAYRVQANDEIAVLHGCGNLAGTGYVSGEAANITTALYDEAATSSAESVAVNEIGSTGWYLISFTPTTVGVWRLSVTNPAGTDELTTDYSVDSVTSLLEASTDNLTTRALVKQRLTISSTKWDALIDELILEVSADLLARMGRKILEATYTEYYDGTNDSRLLLRQGPLVSVTSVNWVEYSDAGDGSREETLTEIEEYERLERGLRSDGHRQAGEIERRGGVWTSGSRCWKVVYTAGYDSVPAELTRVATNEVVSEFAVREVHGLISKTVGEGTIAPLTPVQRYHAVERAIAPYKILGFA